ncbi:MAG TPA: FkbM family methyltransferase [Opitutaceae bacterium]|nr:FkbM family methyltransferase [Opitutaceae bacterium]
MAPAIKTIVTSSFRRIGLDVQKRSSVPFGVHWYQDLKYFPDGSRIDTILDIGANTGQTALSISEAFPAAHVHSFEPVPSTFERLSANVSKFPNIKAVQCAMGSAVGTARITSDNLSETNTLVSNSSATNDKAGAFIDVAINTVDAYCAENNIEHIDLLKIDTEGYEMNVLEGAQRMLSENRVSYILAECEFVSRPNEPHGDFHSIFRHVTAFGFRIVSFYSGGVDNLGWVWGDVLFRKATESDRGHVSTSPMNESK